MTTAAQVRSMGLKVGDTIIGRNDYVSQGEQILHEARLTLLWVGKTVAVWSCSERNSDNPQWSEPHEAAQWNLSYRDWRKVEA